MKIALAAFVTALGVGLIFGPVIIPILRRLKFGQTIRTDGPQGHLKKAGTPTMGGVIFLLGFVVSVLLWGESSPALFLVLAIVLLYGLIGFVDDLIIILLKRSLGLTARQKLLGQFVLAFLFLYIATTVLGRGTALVIPVTGYQLELGGFYYVIMAVYMVGMVNAVNLTDGLDGLCAGISFLVFLAYMLICLLLSGVPQVESTIAYTDLSIAAAALAGGLLAFLFFNHYPAKVFMGDTGSLALGGGVMALTILTKTEIVFLLIGGVYLVEAVSVMLQVASYRLTGKRIFLMSPLHHHFEMKGWKEQKVVRVFWLWALWGILFGLLLTTL